MVKAIRLTTLPCLNLWWINHRVSWLRWHVFVGQFFLESSHIYLLPCQVIPGSVENCLETISRVCMSSHHVVGDGGTPVISIGSLTTSRTFNSTIPYCLCLSQNYSAQFPHPSCVNLPSLIYFNQKLSRQYSAIMRVCLSPSRVRQLCLASKALYHLHYLPRVPHPPHCQHLEDCSNCLQ